VISLDVAGCDPKAATVVAYVFGTGVMVLSYLKTTSFPLPKKLLEYKELTFKTAFNLSFKVTSPFFYLFKYYLLASLLAIADPVVKTT